MLKLGEKGNLVLILVGAFILVLALPWILFRFFGPAKLLFQIIMIFSIYMIVRGFLGGGILTLLVSGILIYILVIKYPAITASVWIFQMLLMFAGFSVMIWVIGTTLQRRG